VTVQRPHDLARSGKTAPPAPEAIGSAEIVELAALDTRADGTRDAIVLSLQATLLLRAGLAVRALVIDALTLIQRTVTFDGTTIVLEFGVYRAAPAFR